jgi:hypothetical protein
MQRPTAAAWAILTEDIIFVDLHPSELYSYIFFGSLKFNAFFGVKIRFLFVAVLKAARVA